MLFITKRYSSTFFLLYLYYMNSIIELRNKDAFNITHNGDFGDWTTNLQQKMVLEKGDAIICKQAYVDTKAQSDMKIVIPHDLNVEIDFLIYNVNYRGAATTGAGADEETDTATSWIEALNPVKGSFFAKTDAEKYIMCSKATLDPGRFYHIDQTFVNSVYLFQNMGNFNVAFRFTNTAGQTQVKNVFVGYYESSGSAFRTTLPLIVDITYDRTITPAGQTDPIEAFILTEPGQDGEGAGAPNLQMRFDTPPTHKEGQSLVYKDTQMHILPVGTPLQGETYTPVPLKSKFVIEQDTYDPQDLCALMNRRMTEIGANISDTNLTDNQFLTQVGGGANTANNNFVKITDGSTSDVYGYEYSNTAPPKFMVWAGASQVELTFDPENQRFGWNYAHSPLYQDAQISVGFASTGAGLKPVRNYGGILFTGLSAFKRNKHGLNDGGFALWTETLGFDTRLADDAGVFNPDCILTNFQLLQTNGTTAYTINNIPSCIPIFNHLPQPKVNYTQGFQGIDTAIQKGNPADGSPPTTTPFYHPLVVGANTLFSTANDTDPILAGSSILSSDSPDLAFGYFLIEVKAQFNNNYITTNENKNHIVAIMSRYYSESSYTSSSSDASLVYTHRSNEPIIINSFKCRVLNSDKKLAQNIGKDNTIFLELVKAPPQMKAIENKK